MKDKSSENNDVNYGAQMEIQKKSTITEELSFVAVNEESIEVDDLDKELTNRRVEKSDRRVNDNQNYRGPVRRLNIDRRK